MQIVNGGQTTASIFHTWKKEKAVIDNIFVQVKLSVIKNKENFSTIVSKISEYANTQNKVSVADLSSNRPYHIEFEKLSRSIFTPISENRSIQTKWFYERARGQYKNERLKESLPKSRLKAFELKTPKSQVFTKEELAKYINAYDEIVEGKKLVIAPHIVVRGNQKNYIQFVNYNLEKKLNNIYFEDAIAKAILFKAAEKVYGVKPNAIGDMRYVTVPYTLGLLMHITRKQIDFWKIWRNQEISKELKELLYEMMTSVEKLIKSTAPGGLYGEWAKKEECWLKIKKHKFHFNLENIKADLIDPTNSVKRKVQSEEDVRGQQIKEELLRIISIPYSVWKKIDVWGQESGELLPNQINLIDSIAFKVKENKGIPEIERMTALKIIDIVIEKAPALLDEVDAIVAAEAALKADDPVIDIELIKKMRDYDRRNKRLSGSQFQVLNNIITNNEALSDYKKGICLKYYRELNKKYGFRG